MKMGTGADRQLRVYRDSGNDLKAVMDYIIEETSVGWRRNRRRLPSSNPAITTKEEQANTDDEYLRFLIHSPHTLPFDPELTPGASQRDQCLLARETEEKITVITDEASAEISGQHHP